MASKYAIYHQATGKFQIFIGDVCTHVANGYSGHGPGLNNPVAEAVPATGPIPCGVYRISRSYHHPSLGPLCFRLDRIGGELFGRSGFRIHGDNRKRNRSASTGCIVLGRPHRVALATSGANLLLVTLDEDGIGLPEGLHP